MRLQSFLLGLGLAGLVAAVCDPAGHKWHPPVEGNSRSLCPGLNALANHGYLRRSGTNLSYPEIQQAATEVFNFADTIFANVFKRVQDFGISTTGNISTFNLVDLQTPYTLEFDGSLSRSDYLLGDNHHFDPEVWAGVAKSLDLYNYNETAYATLEVARTARMARVLDAKQKNPRFNASAMQQSGTATTSGLYMATLWDDAAGAAPKAWIKAFFEEERIPYREGFTRQQDQKNATTISAKINAVRDVPQ